MRTSGNSEVCLSGASCSLRVLMEEKNWEAWSAPSHFYWPLISNADFPTRHPCC